ncbi:NADP-dependent oxidoreductase, partial [Glycomyces buryatensis]
MSEAIAFDAFGGPDVLHLADVDVPEPGPGQVRIAVKAAGINPLDWKIRHGYMEAMFPVEFPHVPGIELSGVVDALGADVTGLKVGDEVFGAGERAYADHALASVNRLARKPSDLDWERAAGIQVAAESALRALEELRLGRGETLLVTGAAGVVGTFAVQFALARGAKVIGAARATRRAELESLGAAAVTLDEDLAARTKVVSPKGIDAALDLVGGEMSLSGAVAAAEGGERVLSLVDPQTAHGVGARFSGGSPEDAFTRPALDQALALHAKGDLALRVHAAYPLAKAAEAHRAGEADSLTVTLRELPD